jgi:hypothetical protein
MYLVMREKRYEKWIEDLQEFFLLVPHLFIE